MRWSTLFSEFPRSTLASVRPLIPSRWHGTILAKLALVPQNILNSYATGPSNPKFGKYKEGDLIANFPGCSRDKPDCAAEQQAFFDILEKNDD
jgi:mannan polymerase II complex MNN11 subunit